MYKGVSILIERDVTSVVLLCIFVLSALYTVAFEQDSAAKQGFRKGEQQLSANGDEWRVEWRATDGGVGRE